VDTLTDELAVCRSDAEREWATAWLLDSVLLPPGRLVQLHGLASQPELNGKMGVIDSPRRANRYPIRLLSTGMTGWPQTNVFSVRAVSVRLVPAPGAAVLGGRRAKR
jgi:hypothetical protein